MTDEANDAFNVFLFVMLFDLCSNSTVLIQTIVCSFQLIEYFNSFKRFALETTSLIE